MPSSTEQLEFYDLSHPWGFQSPNWPYFQDVKIERIHYNAKSGVLSQRITTTMHSTTHIDAPAHVVEGTPFIDEVSPTGSSAPMAIVMGGHVRVGLEDNLFVRRRELATNRQLVEKVVRLADELEREVATPDEARAMLGLKGSAAVAF